MTEKDDRFDEVRKAVEERDRFLAAHPELQPLQDEITRLTRYAATTENRIAILDALLREKTITLLARLKELTAIWEATKAAALENLEVESEEPDENPRVIGPAEDWPRIKRDDREEID